MLTPIRRRRAKALYRWGLLRSRKAVRALALTCPEDQRRQIETDIHTAGRISNAYLLLLTCSCGIAVLGLLQSSTAVVIGAMLISPLMGPIMSGGVSLARFDPLAARQAGVSLGVGALGAVLASALIVWLSPLKDVTPEILARTRPTLLDLVVAVLSGVVGAYVTITGRGAVIAGVAIATALMPPLAVVGYGVATFSPAIAGGALLLFLTNVVAILGAVYAIARLYGFHHVQGEGGRWQVPALLAVTVVICIPLALSLQTIVIETRETSRARSMIEAAFSGSSPRISDLQVNIDHRKLRQVRAIVFTRDYVSNAEATVRKSLGDSADIELEQILAADEAPTLTGSAIANRALTAAQAPVRTPESRLREMLSAVGTVTSIDRRDGNLVATIVLKDAEGLADYFALEVAAQQFLPGTEVWVVPPFRPLPEIQFARGSRTLTDEARRAVVVAAWALKRWNMPGVRIEGVASPGRRGVRPIDLALAEGRGRAVADALAAAGGPPARVTASVPAEPVEDSPQMWVARLHPDAEGATS